MDDMREILRNKIGFFYILNAFVLTKIINFKKKISMFLGYLN